MVAKAEERIVVIEEVITLRCKDNILSNSIINKTEVHNNNSILNTFCFDCSKTDVKLFEKSLVSILNINGEIPATIIDVQVKLDGTKYITVEFTSAVN